MAKRSGSALCTMRASSLSFILATNSGNVLHPSPILYMFQASVTLLVLLVMAISTVFCSA